MMRRRANRVTLLVLSALITSSAFAGGNPNQATAAPLLTDLKLPFYVFRGFKSAENHFAPSGWMGDYGDIRFSDHYLDPALGGKPVIQVTYSAKQTQHNGWTGIYWQNPPNNWGARSGGFNLNGARKVVFQARGAKGGETISEFKVGGIGGNYADSGSAAIGPVTLSPQWKRYEINLDGQELSSISGGFCWTMARDQNPDGAVFFLDDIRYE